MRSSRSAWVWAVSLLLLAALGVWISQAIEWVDIDVQDPPKEPLSRDRFDVAKRLVKKLGGTVEAPQNLERLPPPGATLVLSSRYWALFPARVQALERWVRDGGRLVLFQSGGSSSGEEEAAWLPMRTITPRRDHGGAASAAASTPAHPAAEHDDDDDDDADDDEAGTETPVAAPPNAQASAPADAAPVPHSPASDADKGCVVHSEPDDAHAAYGRRRDYRVCGYSTRRLRAKGSTQWVLQRPDGPVMLRAAHGRGSVTMSSLVSFANSNMLLYDGTLVFAAALSLHPGDVVWFVNDEKRDPFLAHLWATGSPAWLLAFLALGLALWRGSSRFGPVASEPATARRSMAEQIRRTAAYVAHGSGAALHRASVRALEEAARRGVPGYAALVSADERGQAIGAATGLDGKALAAALAAAAAGPAGADASAASGRHLGSAIGLLEQARRRLLITHTSPRATP